MTEREKEIRAWFRNLECAVLDNVLADDIRYLLDEVERLRAENVRLARDDTVSKHGDTLRALAKR